MSNTISPDAGAAASPPSAPTVDAGPAFASALQDAQTPVAQTSGQGDIGASSGPGSQPADDPTTSKQSSGNQNAAKPPVSLSVSQQGLAATARGSDGHGSVIGQFSYDPRDGTKKENIAGSLNLGPSMTTLKVGDQQGGASTSRGVTEELQEKIKLAKGDSIDLDAQRGPQGKSIQAGGTVTAGRFKLTGSVVDKLDGKNPGETYDGSAEYDRDGGDKAKFDFKYTPAQAQRQISLSDTEQLTSKIGLTGTFTHVDGGKTPGNTWDLQAKFKVGQSTTIGVGAKLDQNGRVQPEVSVQRTIGHSVSKGFDRDAINKAKEDNIAPPPARE